MPTALYLDLKTTPAFMDDIRVIDFRTDNSNITKKQIELLIAPIASTE